MDEREYRTMEELKKYKIRILGPSGTGKSFFRKKLGELGYNAIDGDYIEDLCYWYDPKTGKYEKNYPGHEGIPGAEWHWNLDRLREFLKENPKTIILGNCNNQKDREISACFDYTFYFDVSPQTIMDGLLSEDRYSDGMNDFGKTQEQRDEILEYAKHFYNNLEEDWIPLTARDDAKKLIEEIEGKIGFKLEK